MNNLRVITHSAINEHLYTEFHDAASVIVMSFDIVIVDKLSVIMLGARTLSVIVKQLP
jgi:hypothetical protein